MPRVLPSSLRLNPCLLLPSLLLSSGWSECPNGFYMNGLQRSAATTDLNPNPLHIIQDAMCARPMSASGGYAACLDIDVTSLFNGAAAVDCPAEHFMTGIYRGVSVGCLPSSVCGSDVCFTPVCPCADVRGAELHRADPLLPTQIPYVALS